MKQIILALLTSGIETVMVAQMPIYDPEYAPSIHMHLDTVINMVGEYTAGVKPREGKWGVLADPIRSRIGSETGRHILIFNDEYLTPERMQGLTGLDKQEIDRWKIIEESDKGTVRPFEIRWVFHKDRATRFGYKAYEPPPFTNLFGGKYTQGKIFDLTFCHPSDFRDRYDYMKIGSILRGGPEKRITKLPREEMDSLAFNWLSLSENKVLMAEHFKGIHELLKKYKVDIKTVKIEDLVVGRGGVRCMTLPILRK